MKNVFAPTIVSSNESAKNPPRSPRAKRGRKAKSMVVADNAVTEVDDNDEDVSAEEANDTVDNKVNLSTAQAFQLATELQNCKKSEVFEVLAKHGIVFKTRSWGSYAQVDEKIIELAGQQEMGMNSRAIHYFLEQAGFTITAAQMNTRLIRLQAQEKLKLNKSVGCYVAIHND